MVITLTQLNHDELIVSLRSLVARSNQVEADIIEHIQEVESRALHLERAYPSLFSFLTEALGFSEGAAYNRIEVARAARRIPALLLSLRRGEIHLTGLRLLAPHLTEANHAEILLRAKGKSKRAIEEIIADLAPKPQVADAVRKLPEKKVTPAQMVPLGVPAPAVPPPLPATPVQAELLTPLASMARSTQASPAPSMSEAPAGRTYGIHFTASAALEAKLREAQDLLRHQVLGGDLAQVVEKALDALLAQIKKKRFGIGRRPRARVSSDSGRASRHVPAEVSRQIFERDGGRCAFVAEDGRRCEETAGLELDHLDGFARTGTHDPARMRLACKAHNAHAADKMYGRAFMLRARRRAVAPKVGTKQASMPEPPNSSRLWSGRHVKHTRRVAPPSPSLTSSSRPPGRSAPAWLARRAVCGLPWPASPADRQPGWSVRRQGLLRA